MPRVPEVPQVLAQALHDPVRAMHDYRRDRVQHRVRRIERDTGNTNQPNDFDAAGGGRSVARADRARVHTRPAQ